MRPTPQKDYTLRQSSISMLNSQPEAIAVFSLKGLPKSVFSGDPQAALWWLSPSSYAPKTFYTVASITRFSRQVAASSVPGSFPLWFPCDTTPRKEYH